jgi:hypothetical protein
LEFGARLAVFGHYLREIAAEQERISESEAEALVRRVEDFKIAADPHPRRVALAQAQIQTIARSICEPLNELVAQEMGGQRSLVIGPRERPPCEVEITLCLDRSVHNLVMHAAAVTRRTKRELAQDLLEAAGAMGRVAGRRRQARLCGGPGTERVGPRDIVGTWIRMLVAAGCISDRSKSDEPSHQANFFRDALVDWYEVYSHRGVESLEVDLDRTPTVAARTEPSHPT